MKSIKFLAFYPWLEKVKGRGKYTSEDQARTAYKKYRAGKRKEVMS